ncbi:hypothetical protein [Streptomyces sp. HNM0574]|uniref:hypothetical protein n=1 Tax=Streptomyces sp. HNM0574 TaxID=2714954 RepID=UPI00146CFBD0|nr:hypothetical protein [Streptomyces sp. HNM0574]NLU68458.1 cytochrome c-type biogenesis protein CcmH [Streptomyces sp. HNM0574]
MSDKLPVRGRSISEHGLSDQKYTLVFGDTEYPRRVALPVVGGFAALVLGGIFGVWSFTQSRREEDSLSSEEQEGLAALAREHGWTYRETESGVIDAFEGVEPFPDASTGLLAGHYTHGRHRGRNIRYFEYEDETAGTKVNGRTQHDYYAVFAVSTPGTVPRTLIRGKGFMDSVFGGGEVVGTGDDAFDADHHVIAEDPAAAERLAVPELTRYLAKQPLLADRPLRFENGEVITWYEERLRPGDVMKHLTYLSEVLRHIPESAWR